MIWFVPAGAALLGLGVAWGLGDALPPALAAHAGLMIAAWGAILPAGAVVARYHKVRRGQDFPRVFDNPFWWTWHQGLQYSGMALSLAGLALVLSETGGRLATTHGWIGLSVIALGILQVLAGWLRGSKGGPTGSRADPRRPETWRGDHYDMTPRRHVFEGWHKVGGWTALLLAGAAILTGIDLAGAPDWLLAAAGALFAAPALGILDGAARGRWVDTYKALWGVDPRHPGNRRRDRAPRAVRRPRPETEEPAT